MPRARWFGRTMAVAGVGAASGILASLEGSRRWRVATERMAAELERAARTPEGRVSFTELETLPDPARRYFRRVLREGQPRIRSVRVWQSGTFRSRTTADPETGWAPFTATQFFTTDPPGFVWNAAIRVAALVPVRVRDGYVGGAGSMRGAVAGLVPVMDAADSAELRSGALQRYLAEAVWLPTALLPGQGVSWSAMDDTHARATLTHGETSVSVEFEFGPNGEIIAVYSPSRLRAEPGRAGAYVPAPWGGRYRDYEERTGMRVPSGAEVYWVLDGREQPYFRGRNEDVEYDFG